MWVVSPGWVGRGPWGAAVLARAEAASTIGCMVANALSIELFDSAEELAYRGEEPPREARTTTLPAELDPRVRDAIGVATLYAHQREAWDAAARGEHLIVTTGTASGKTLAFNLPVLDTLARDPKSRALYLYPTN